MSTSLRTVLDEALALPEPERAALISALIQSLEPTTDAGVDAAWDAEIARRVAELDAGNAQTVPWSEVQLRLRSAAGLSDQ